MKEELRKWKIMNEPETEIINLSVYKLNKDILVPKKLKNGLSRLIKIEKGKVYKWDKIVDRGGNILIARSINLDGDIRKYRNVLKLKRKDLDKYFTELKECC